MDCNSYSYTPHMLDEEDERDERMRIAEKNEAEAWERLCDTGLESDWVKWNEAHDAWLKVLFEE